MLQLKNIIKNYQVGEQQIQALNGLTIDFRQNEFVSILGPSGCGKTTLMNIIGGLDRATSGDLLINGKSTKGYSDSDWDNYRNKKIGFIFQNYNLIPHLSVYGNVEMALTISGISKDERRRLVTNALEEVGLSNQRNQRPNQLSGGQMQRVAIARALVNSPEILLADEPTGALDTKTSVQIMSIIQEVAKNRLVIMVTHNPEIANTYSTRIIKMLDGKVIEDSAPFNALNDLEYIQEVAKNKKIDELSTEKKKKSSMSYRTAISLSKKNLLTKKGRTILTSIAGSIGIIGIALILALSTGMNNYINKMQTDTLASNPITISDSSINITQAMRAMNNRTVLQDFPNAQKIFVEKSISMADLMDKNNITDDYTNYINTNLNSDWYNDIIYKTGLNLNVYGVKAGTTAYSSLAGRSFSSTWQMLLNNDFLNMQYDLLGNSKIPSNKNEIVIIVDQKNQMSDTTLIALGLKDATDTITEYNFSDIIGTEYKIVDNNLLYESFNNYFIERSPLDIDFGQAETLTITGILRINEETEGGVLSTGIGYTKELYSWLQTTNGNSAIVDYMNDNETLNPLTGLEFEAQISGSSITSKEEVRLNALREYGGNSTPNEISIYPTSFEAKNSIKDVLNDYNIDKEKSEMITFTDMSEIFASTISSIINVVSYVLIAFTAISLIVSSIMISIITYVSVLERTKEIGILRSIGARKKDISRVFNAETIIIGFCAGTLGVVMAYLLSIPINMIITSLIGVANIASLNIISAAILILISIFLTLLSGFIPAKKAAKQDSVIALRTE